MITAWLAIEELFLGPTDSALILSHFSFWSLISTFSTMLLQYKAANYEIEKLQSFKRGSNKKFPYSVYYKREALQSLEVAVCINFIVFIAYWFWVFPTAYEQYKLSTLDETYGENWYSVSYYYYRSIVMHSLPFMMTICTIFFSDIIFLESDWYIVFVITALYLIINFALCEYTGTNSVYFLDWSIISKISAYSPLVASVGFSIIALGQHFFYVLMTQTLRQRYEFEFTDYNNNVS